MSVCSLMHMKSSEIPLVGRLFQLPYSVELFSYQGFRSFFSRKNIESMRAEFAEEGKVPECIDQAGEILALQFQHHPGYARGVMSTLKHFPFTALAPTYGALQEEKFPVQVIWGTRDTVVPGTSVDAVERVLPRIKVTKIEGATHSIVMTHPEAIVQRLGGFVV
ncbi:hypothetical protein BGW38_010412 [Lunasporangiospora selenospora]|uniref:Alpha/beta hydrolase family protein n=1 Tax=Lunasporangiospora selenospora TaxID=979761 RepID=A0A9P6G2F1_9FUNG|nr:hypothetical protein BGW38_010412 [Lunasporangiospora selenospora]